MTVLAPELVVLLDKALASKGLIVTSRDTNLLIRRIEHAKSVETAYKALSVRTFQGDYSRILIIPKFLLENRSHVTPTLKPEDLDTESLLGGDGQQDQRSPQEG